MAQSQSIDIEQFLKDNKLEEVVDIFVKRNVTIEELLEFNTQDLRTFAQDIGLDMLQQNRFVKAINTLKSSSPSAPVQQQNQQHTVSQLPNGWTMSHTNDGKIYYQNNITKSTQWDRPTESAVNSSGNAGGYEIKQPSTQQHGDALKAATTATCMCGSVVCGTINIILGFVAWIIVILGSAAPFVTPIPQILAFVGILIFIISNMVAACMGGLCGGSCCSNSLRKAAWGLFGFSCVAAIGVIGGSFACGDNCVAARAAGGIIGTIFFISTILFVIDNCKNARTINDGNN